MVPVFSVLARKGDLVPCGLSTLMFRVTNSNAAMATPDFCQISYRQTSYLLCAVKLLPLLLIDAIFSRCA
jgi:hypothetical protein